MRTYVIARPNSKEELENEEVNRELCALAVEDMFESWSPETQEQVLAEWTTGSKVIIVLSVEKFLHNQTA